MTISPKYSPQEMAVIASALLDRARQLRDMMRHAADNRDDWYSSIPVDVIDDWKAEAELLENASTALSALLCDSRKA